MILKKIIGRTYFGNIFTHDYLLVITLYSKDIGNIILSTDYRNHAATYILGKRGITEVSITPKHKNKSHVVLMQTPSIVYYILPANKKLKGNHQQKTFQSSCKFDFT